MDLVALGNVDMEKEHAVYPYDQSEPYISISNEDKENLILELDINNGESITYDMDGSDEYWNFVDNPTCENLIKNSIHGMSNKGSVYSKICGSPIYDTSIKGSMDTWENISMEEEHSKFSHDHS